MLRSAVVVPVPEAAPFVDRWRERTSGGPSSGVPAHVTLLFPFVPAAELADEVTAALAELVGGWWSFPFALARTGRFERTLYLAPDPSERFVRLTESLVERFPAYPPYGGAFDRIVPHLTVAQGEAGVLDEAEADVRRLLPIAAVAREAVVLEEVEPDGRRWRVGARLPFACAPTDAV